jgi:acetyl esterase/lipase
VATRVEARVSTGVIVCLACDRDAIRQRRHRKQAGHVDWDAPARFYSFTDVEGDADMPSQAMQESIDALRERQQASGGQAPPPLKELRAAFVPGDRLHPVPDDVLVTEVTVGGVPSHWLAAPGTDPGRVLLFLHGGGFELGSVRSDGELAARLGRAGGMRVLFPEYRLAPEHHFPAATDQPGSARRTWALPAR